MDRPDTERGKEGGKSIGKKSDFQYLSANRSVPPWPRL